MSRSKQKAVRKKHRKAVVREKAKRKALLANKSVA